MDIHNNRIRKCWYCTNDMLVSELWDNLPNFAIHHDKCYREIQRKKQ